MPNSRQPVSPLKLKPKMSGMKFQNVTAVRSCSAILDRPCEERDLPFELDFCALNCRNPAARSCDLAAPNTGALLQVLSANIKTFSATASTEQCVLRS
jgi:hypothetical protein